jgi:hypothetical protein
MTLTDFAELLPGPHFLLPFFLQFYETCLLAFKAFVLSVILSEEGCYFGFIPTPITNNPSFLIGKE